ncbi:hypothetical protein [Phytoactinopolyspora halophila]|uniref:hypothetical protein n=1 Tax=Phytoactinopolyspora halophila TaxID=1981511 RepID=UPI0013145338|nr:hypothetical protein [Phytoactinopolyspora halophila]
MLRIETEKREAVLVAAALRSRRRSAGRNGRRAASARAVSALRQAATEGARSTSAS